MLDIEKQFPGVKALDHAKLQLRPGSIHALMGENGAGKSTLMKCLFGIYKKDAGSIRMNGKEINFTNPRNALDHGVAMVHQELNQVLYRSVMENMWLGRFPLKAGLVDHKKMYNDTKAVLDDLEIKVDPKAIIGTMAVSQRQMLEIAKAVSYNAKILVLDEPTSSLTSEEVEHLFRIMRRLCDQGVGIIYISHKMDEIKRISDEVTIMRDGQWISTDKTENLSTDDIIKRMVNREMTNRFPAKDNVPGDVLMEVSHLTGKYMPTCQDVSFELRAGEVLGIAGFLGSGRSALARALFGIDPLLTGSITLNQAKLSLRSPNDAVRHGIGYISDASADEILCKNLPIAQNITMANIRGIQGPYHLDLRLEQEVCRAFREKLVIQTAEDDEQVQHLSRGNQQKVLLSKWIFTSCQILMIDEPCRNVDQCGKVEIYNIINKLVLEGKSVILISSNFEELLGMSDRILVMQEGTIVRRLERSAFSINAIIDALSAPAARKPI